MVSLALALLNKGALALLNKGARVRFRIPKIEIVLKLLVVNNSPFFLHSLCLLVIQSVQLSTAKCRGRQNNTCIPNQRTFQGHRCGLQIHTNSLIL